MTALPRLWFLALLALSLGEAVLPTAGLAHSKGLYSTREEAEQRARQLGCQGTHQNKGRWMPCRDEAQLHQRLRRQ